MTMEFWSTMASIGTFLVIAATAIAAAIQLRHLRASNQFSGMLAVLERFENPSFIRYNDFVRSELKAKIAESGYRKSLEMSPVLRQEHPELYICGWWEWVGAMIKRGLLPEEAFMDIFSSQVKPAWTSLEPVVAIMRRTRGSDVWENFEYLAARAQRWAERHPTAYPKHTPRLKTADEWLIVDAH